MTHTMKTPTPILFKAALLVSLLGITLSLSTGCKKYLDDVKSEQKLAVPSSLADLQALMDNFNIISAGHASAGEVSSTDYYLTDADYNALFYNADRRLYTWQKDYVFNSGNTGNDWESAYTAVYTCNTVLEQLDKLGRSAANAAQWDDLKGQALLQRGYRFLEVLQLWAPAYNAASAGTDSGIPLRLSTDFNQKSVRASVADGFARITADLRTAVPLLSTHPLSAIRGSRQAAYALLARMYLYLRDYPIAGSYADSCLQINASLLDYNTLNAATAYPVPNLNTEVLYYAALSVERPVYNKIAKIDPALYALYDDHDLRKTLFYKANTDGSYYFRGSYLGGYSPAGSPATDEMYLIRAESEARAGQADLAMKDLNTLWTARYQAGSFVPLSVGSAADALKLVLLERRKELVMRGLRWTDIKRLNQENAGISLSRTVSGTTYRLAPGDPRFVLPIPEDVIATSGMPQNP